MLIFTATQSDLAKYNGLRCDVLRELSNKCDNVMYEIRLENGIVLHAFNDEFKLCTGFTL